VLKLPCLLAQAPPQIKISCYGAATLLQSLSGIFTVIDTDI
jgi:hypothetical protein